MKDLKRQHCWRSVRTICSSSIAVRGLYTAAVVVVVVDVVVTGYRLSPVSHQLSLENIFFTLSWLPHI